MQPILRLLVSMTVPLIVLGGWTVVLPAYSSAPAYAAGVQVMPST
jgi:hypothetical protein